MVKSYKKNSRGFTLIELLAVIVILAVLILLAMPAVLRLMDSAQRNAFVVEVNQFARAGEMAYTEKSFTSGQSTMCFTLSYLVQEGYIKKNSVSAIDPKYQGFVSVERDGAVKVTMTNTTYTVQNVTSEDLNDASKIQAGKTSLTYAPLGCLPDTSTYVPTP